MTQSILILWFLVWRRVAGPVSVRAPSKPALYFFDFLKMSSAFDWSQPCENLAESSTNDHMRWKIVYFSFIRLVPSSRALTWVLLGKNLGLNCFMNSFLFTKLILEVWLCQGCLLQTIFFKLCNFYGGLWNKYWAHKDVHRSNLPWCLSCSHLSDCCLLLGVWHQFGNLMVVMFRSIDWCFSCIV